MVQTSELRRYDWRLVSSRWCLVSHFEPSHDVDWQKGSLQASALLIGAPLSLEAPP